MALANFTLLIARSLIYSNKLVVVVVDALYTAANRPCHRFLLSRNAQRRSRLAVGMCVSRIVLYEIAHVVQNCDQDSPGAGHPLILVNS
jgi:hypothetical protein